MSTQSYEVVPGDSVGEIVLGAPLIVVTRQLKDTPQFGVIHVSYGPNPHMQAISLTASRRNMTFVFHHVTHRLESISITDMTSTELVYRSQILAGPSRSTTFAHVYSVLGPTFQGSMDAETGLYTLKYPGIEVEFLIPAKFHAEFCDRGTHPTKLPDGSVPVAKRIKILLSPNSSTRLQRDLSYAKGRVIAGDLVSFDWSQRILVFQSSNVSIPFGVSPQELIYQLGCSPHRIFNLVENKMGIHHQHVGSAKASLERRAPLYSFNYPLLGVDFIFGGDHRLEKVMLHNPQPSYETFLRYQRCNYALACPWNLGRDADVDGGDSDSLDVHEMNNGFLWSEQEDAFAAARSVKPLISSSGCSNGLVLKIYAFSGIAIYVMPSTRLVVKVLLFEKRLPPPKHRAPMLLPAQANTNFGSGSTDQSNCASLASDSGPFAVSEAALQETDACDSPPMQDMQSPMKRADTSAPPRFVDPFPVECAEGDVEQADIPPKTVVKSDRDVGSAPLNPWASGAPTSVTYAMEPAGTAAFNDEEDEIPADVDMEVDGEVAEEEAEEAAAEEEAEEGAAEEEAEEAAAEEEAEVGAAEEEAEEAAAEEEAENDACEYEAAAEAEEAAEEEEETTELEAPPSFSVPPPLVSLVDNNGQRQESGERYEDDFEESTSRHFSLKSSSYAPSANQSPTIPTAQTTTEDASDRWPTLPPPTAATHGDGGQALPSPTEDESPLVDSTESPDAEDNSSPPSAADSKTTSPPNRSPLGNHSMTSTSSNQKSKKNKKKRR